jgi:hypothetical protein
MAIRIGRAMAASLGIGFMCCTAAAAQDIESAGAKATAYREVHSSCSTDTERFCPEIGQVTTIPREQVMCLKTYHFDLTLACRKALAHVKAATELEQ